MLRVFVNTHPFYVINSFSILETLTFLGLKIPRFCYHEALSIAGNCRVCLVEIDLGVKLVASCAQPLSEDLEIFTNTIKVIKGRENVLESLLLNHPLDCPVCDQAGECDLQDQSKVFGGSLTRNFFIKRSVENKIIDPCIKTIMTRCIHCTRCVRYASEITGTPYLGTLNRGRNTEIGTYTDYLNISSEISGNVVDLCPVGALTAKPYAFQARPWELRSIETVDLTDGLGSGLYINLKELSPISILPKMVSTINGQWISNKGRFSIDSNKNYRILDSYIQNKDHSFEQVDFNALIKRIKIENEKQCFTFIINEESDLKSLANLKRVSSQRNSQIRIVRNPSAIKIENYYTNAATKIAELNNETKTTYLLFSTNLRIECAVLNIKLRLKSKDKYSQFYSLGARQASPKLANFTFTNISPTIIKDLLEGKSLQFSKIFSKTKFLVAFLGDALLQRLFMSKQDLRDLILNLNRTSVSIFINQKANTEGVALLHFPKISEHLLMQKNNITILYKQEDNNDTRYLVKKNKGQSIWVHSHGSPIAKQCYAILPTVSTLESEGIFLNLEKRPQKTGKIQDSCNSSVIGASNLDILLIELLNLQGNAIQRPIKALTFINELVLHPKRFDTLTFKLIKDCAQTVEMPIALYSQYPLKPVNTNFYLTNNNVDFSLHMQKYAHIQKKFNNVLTDLIN